MNARGGLFVVAVAGMCAVSGCASSGGASSTAAHRRPSTQVTSAPVVVPSVSLPPYPTSTSTAQPRGVPQGARGVLSSDSLAVATRFVQMSYAQDTTIDTSPWDALKRASVLATATYGAQIRSSQPVAAPGAQWNTWATHHAYTRVTVTQQATEDQPPPSTTTAFYTFTVKVSVVETASTVAPVVVFVHVTRPVTDQPWRVASLTVSSQ